MTGEKKSSSKSIVSLCITYLLQLYFLICFSKVFYFPKMSLINISNQICNLIRMFISQPNLNILFQRPKSLWPFLELAIDLICDEVLLGL